MIRASRAAALPQAATIRHLDGPLIAAVRALLPQLSRYTVVSAVALGLDFMVFLLLTHATGMRASFAGIVGYSIGLLLHFLLSSRFVFDTHAVEKSSLRLFAEFAASGLVGLAITAGVLALAVDLAQLPAVIGKAGAVAISFASVFMLRRTLVFASSKGLLNRA